jgi:hypothetical protein
MSTTPPPDPPAAPAAPDPPPPTTTYEDQEKIIGGAILRFAQIEALVDAIIETHYAPGSAEHPLLYDVLADEGFSFSLRCNVLSKVLERRGMLDKRNKEQNSQLQRLRGLGNKRNFFAHIGKLGMLGGKIGYLHGKRFDKLTNSLELAQARKEFDEDCEALFPFLGGIVTAISPFQQEMRRRADAGEPLPEVTVVNAEGTHKFPMTMEPLPGAPGVTVARAAIKLAPGDNKVLPPQPAGKASDPEPETK